MDYEWFVQTHCWCTNKHAFCQQSGKLVPITIYGGNRVWVHEACKDAALERNAALIENIRARGLDD